MTRGRVLSAALLLAVLTSRAGVGQSLSFNDGVHAELRKDYAEAIRIWRTLGERGDLPSQVRLAEIYQTGQGVAADYREAMTWARKASDQSGDGMVVQGWLYAEGRGVAKDAKKAFELYRKGAGKGSPWAAQHLAEAYHRGAGTSKDDKQAWLWLNRTQVLSKGRGPGFGYLVLRDELRAAMFFRKVYWEPTNGRVGYHMVATNKYLPSEAPDANCKLHVSAVKIDGKLPPGMIATNGGLVFEGTPRQPGEWAVRATLTGLTCAGEYESYGDRVVDVTFKITP